MALGHWTHSPFIAAPTVPLSRAGAPQMQTPPFPWICAGLVRCPLSLVMQRCFWPSRASVVSHVLVLSRVGMAFPMSLLWC